MRTLGRWHFQVRIKSKLILADPQGQRLCQLREIKLAPRETRCFHNVTITGQHFGPVYLALGRPTEGAEQWQVVSSEATNVDTFAEYGERFQIEEGCLDDKSGLFGLEASGLRDADSLNRLVLILALATLFLVLKGVETVSQGRRRTVDPHWQRGLSYLKIGLRAAQWAIARLALETVAIRITVPTLTSADVARLEGDLAQMQQFQFVGDQMGLHGPHWAFHRTLVAAAGPRVLAQISELSDHVERYRLSYSALGDWKDHRAEHRAILDAAAAGHAELAAERLAEHYVHTAQLVFGVLSRDHGFGRLRTTLRAVAPGAEAALKGG